MEIGGEVSPRAQLQESYQVGDDAVRWHNTDTNGWCLSRKAQHGCAGQVPDQLILALL